MTPPKDQAPGLVDTPGAKHTDTLVARIKDEVMTMTDADGFTWVGIEDYADLRAKLERLNSEEGGFGDNLGSVAVSHLREMYGAAYDALGSSGRRSLRNFINARAALTEQANIRSPVQSEGRSHD
ncbi:hypothetical protein [Falsirhodobacter xinxiangensis]|uniref:hypothetical protein n=1 Tax=Falsirhodobacter xinxiangensis TaxID=2530049 RepID=UPI0010A99E68|nr:hypothetical protein [Rhodobacter xinxiangensis]